MATNHRGNPLHAGKRTRDQYPRLTRAVARMSRRDGFIDAHKPSWDTGWIPEPGLAMDIGESLIDKYSSASEIPAAHKNMGSMIGRAFKERNLPDRDIYDDTGTAADIQRPYQPKSSGGN